MTYTPILPPALTAPALCAPDMTGAATHQTEGYGPWCTECGEDEFSRPLDTFLP